MILEPFASLADRTLSASRIGGGSRLFRKPETFANNSLDCRCAREISRLVEPGRKTAVHAARTAEHVLLPDCREQHSRTWRDVDRRNSTCQGSGSNPRQSRAHVAGSR